jgi:hypothetical protein
MMGLVPADRSEGRDELTIVAEGRVEDHLSVELSIAMIVG